MSLKLSPPRPGQSSNWRIRGTHLGVAIDQSAKTADRKIASKYLTKIKADIEAGKFAAHGAPTFASASIAYRNAGGSQRFMAPLIRHFAETPLSDIDQAAIDNAAARLYPAASAATRNRQVYTPVSAILRHAGVAIIIRRPKGSQGTRRTAWLEQDQAFAVMAAATRQSARFGALLTFLLYTGARLGEALALTWGDVDLDGERAVIRQTKTEGVRTAFLPKTVVAALAPFKGKPAGRVFQFTKSGRLYSLLEAAAAEAGVNIPERIAFHIFRHTWATWMRRHAGLDTAALVETGAWRSRKSASVYEHLDATEEAKKVAKLPTPKAAPEG